jgi:hypothetical protein
LAVSRRVAARCGIGGGSEDGGEEQDARLGFHDVLLEKNL